MNERLQQLAKKIVPEVRRSAEDYSRLKGFKLDSVVGLFRTTVAVVKRVEAAGIAEGIKGADKQALAIEVLFETVKLPWWIPQDLLRQVLPVVIDLVVDALKDRFGA